MAGDGIKSLTQTTTSPSNLSDTFSAQQNAMALAEVMDPQTAESIANILGSCSGIPDSGALYGSPAPSQIKTEVQIKSEPTDDFRSNSCCLHQAASLNTYPKPLANPATPVYGSGHTELAVKVKREPTIHPNPGSRKTRKAKMPNQGEKKERRKAQNRKAAKNYREKQKSKKEQVESDYSRLISDNSEKTEEISMLQKELHRLQSLLQNHKQCGSCRMLCTSFEQMSTAQTRQDEVPPTYMNPLQVISRIPQSIDIPDFPLVSEKDKAPQVPPYTPNSEQSFGFEANIYSPQTDEKLTGREQVYSPLDDAMDFSSPESVEAFNNMENIDHQNILTMDTFQLTATLDLLR